MTRWYLVNESTPDGRRLYGGNRGEWVERRSLCEPFASKKAAFLARREWERENVDCYVVRVGYRSALADAKERARSHQLEIRNSEARALLTRMVKYCREDKATTARATRLERLVEQVADYLNRTRDPNEILRASDTTEAER